MNKTTMMHKNGLGKERYDVYTCGICLTFIENKR